jgi:hypothetical protein
MITAEHKAQYEEIGCVRIEGAFSERWVDTVTAGVDRVLEMFRAGSTPEPVWDCRCPISPAYYEVSGGEQMNGIMACAEEFRDWMLHSPATQIVGELTGADDLRFWVDAAFCKSGHDERQATPWHNDECTYGYKGEQIPSLWMALTDVDEDNAPLLTLAGSNHDPHRYHSTFAPQDAERPPDYLPWQHLLDRVAAPDADIRCWAVKAGDALLIHPKTIHGSRPRTSNNAGRRVSFSTRWLGSDAVWDPNPLTLPLANLPDQNVLIRGEKPPESIFPVVWRRGE